MSLTTTLASSLAAASLASTGFLGVSTTAAGTPTTTSVAPAAVGVIAPLWITDTFCRLIRPIYKGC